MFSNIFLENAIDLLSNFLSCHEDQHQKFCTLFGTFIDITCQFLDHSYNLSV